MENLISTVQAVASPRPPRVDGPSPASERRQDARVTRTGEARSEKPPETPPEPDAAQVRQAAGRLNQALKALNRDLAISVDEGSGKLIVEVSDPSTGEVVRQIPSNRLLEVEESIDKIVGLFVDNTA